MSRPWPPQRFRDFAYASYLLLFKQFPLLSLRTDEDRDKATEVLEFFANRKPAPSSGEQEYIDVLSDLVIAYDAKPRPEPELPVQEPQETPQEPADDFYDDEPVDEPPKKGRRR